MGAVKAGDLKLDIMAMSIGLHFFRLNTLLDVLEIRKPIKTFWPYGHFKLEIYCDDHSSLTCILFDDYEFD